LERCFISYQNDDWLLSDRSGCRDLALSYNWQAIY
jgi:hypothetical protein